MNEKTLLQTKGRHREKAPATGKSAISLSLHELQDGKLNLDDRAYCLKFGEPKDFAAIRKQIEARRDKIPAWSFWKCSNPKCGWKTRKAGDAGGGSCLRCNFQNYVDGGQLEKMSEAEADKFLADEKAAEEKWIADAPRRAAELSEFNKRLIQNMPKGGIG